jgi:hypothetical protein
VTFARNGEAQMTDLIIGYRTFVNGTRRPMYEAAHSQYVLNDDGERV